MTAALVLPVGDRDHVAGRRDAPIVLVEYGDFECPFCGAAFPIVESARAQLGDRLCFVFRHFPITEEHPHAELAAEASEAAAAQGRFWEMHHALFEHQSALEPSDILEYARAIGLDVDRVSRELSDHRYANRVAEDFTTGVRSGVNGTPTFFINGVRYDGRWNNGHQFVEDLANSAAS